MPPRFTIITHTDLDGVAAAAIYLRVVGASIDSGDVRLVFTEPYKLLKVIKNLGRSPSSVVAVMDLGPNASTIGELASKLSQMVKKGTRVEWYDHHRWDEDWLAKLREAGVNLFVDTSTCAAGVVERYATELYGVTSDEFAKELVGAVCAADLWKWDHPWAPRLFRIAERYRGRKGDAWRRMLVKGFSQGSLWWPELSLALDEYIRREFEGFRYSLKRLRLVEVNGCRVALVLKKPGPPSPSILGNGLASRLNVDVVVLVRTRGKGLSLRSRSVNVRDIAYHMGGGGHLRAAGAPLNMPLLLRAISRLLPSLRLRFAEKQLREVLKRVGCKHAAE
jgi:oligoribonuclease NrnB/cAMP/cGMP phosphodiesterase (DHH superfamily)